MPPSDDFAWRLRRLEERLDKLEALLRESDSTGRGVATKNDVRYVKEELEDFIAWSRGEMRALGGNVE